MFGSNVLDMRYFVTLPEDTHFSLRLRGRCINCGFAFVLKTADSMREKFCSTDCRVSTCLRGSANYDADTISPRVIKKYCDENYVGFSEGPLQRQARLKQQAGTRTSTSSCSSSPNSIVSDGSTSKPVPVPIIRKPVHNHGSYNY